MERDSFIFYRSFYEAVACLDDEDRLACLDAICEYALNGTTPEESAVASAILTMAKPTIDKNNERFVNGKRGGRPAANRQETEPEPEGTRTETKPKPKTNRTGTKAQPNVDVDKDVDVDKELKRGTRPTIEEVRDYCAQRGNRISAEAFVAYYEANGWKVGRNPMKDWKACVRSWEARDQKIQPVRKFTHEDRHTYDFDQLAGILSRPVGGAL